MHRPPIITSLLARLFLHDIDETYVLGDLQEIYGELYEKYGSSEARRWYREQVFRSMPVVVWRTIYRYSYMLKHYLKTALRSVRKQKGHAFINIAGLAAGLTCVLLIALYIQHELSYDRFFSEADRIYRVNLDLETPGGMNELATTPANAVPTMASSFPEIEQGVRVYKPFPTTVSRDDRVFKEAGFVYAEDGFFDLFDFPFIQGDPATALLGPDRIVLTESAAHKYFGDADPLGEMLSVMDSLLFEVTGVMADVPSNSHIQFDMVASLTSFLHVFPDMMDRWSPHMFHSYVKLAPGSSREALEAQFPDMVRTNVQLSGGYMFHFRLLPITSIHFGSHRNPELGTNSQIEFVYTFGAIALLILIIACVNFMNLSTARATRRMREVGMRKSFGAHRAALVGQFLGEALLFAFVSVVLAIVGVWLMLPVFNSVAGTRLSISGMASAPFIATIAGTALLVGLAAGSYPAFYLSAFRPARVLRGDLQGAGGRSSALRLRRGLVVFQFCISAFLIGGTGVVYQQLTYMREHNLGFNPSQILVLSAFSAADRNEADVFEDRARGLAAVQEASQSNAVPGRSPISLSYSVPPLGESEFQVVDVLFTDPDFAETYGLQLAAGRDFDAEFTADSSMGFMINEALARDVGWTPEEAVGQPLSLTRGTGRIVGVYRDFHYRSLQEPYKPMVFVSTPYAYNSAPLLLSLRISTGNLQETVASLEEIWNSMLPERPFEFFFLDEDFDSQYRTETRLGGIFSAFGGLAVLIACLGLFGLASLTAEQKTREIGVRKALGASVVGVVGMLAGDFLRLIGVAFLISVPLTYFAARSWLQGFAYHMEPGVWLYIGTGVLLGAIAVLTVGYQAVRAATANPVDALRHP